MSDNWKTPNTDGGQKSDTWDSDATVTSTSWTDGVMKQASDWSNPTSDSAETSITEVTSTSWFDRLKGALTGLLIGLLFIPGSAWLLFWNEGRAVQTARSLSEGAGAVQMADAARVDPAREGQLVHVSGALAVASVLRDADFDVRAPGALRLLRSVEMYQWREERRSETRTQMGGSQETVTTYSYNRGWSATHVDSSRFRQPDGHANPQMRYGAHSTVAQDVRLGARRLTAEQVSHLGEARPLALDAKTITMPFGATVVDGSLYIGRDPHNPQIGDMRIRFSMVPAETASIVAAQRGDGFAPFQTRAGDRVMILRAGTVPAAEMFQQAQEGNQMLTWVLRVAGAFLMFMGWSMIFRPLAVLGSVVPVFGAIIGAGTGLIAAILTLVIAPVVIGVAWIVYRPVIGILVLALGLATAAGLTWLARQRRAAAPAGVAPAR